MGCPQKNSNMEEKIGTVKHVIHARTNGFLTYTNDNGEEDSIYFSCKAEFHKSWRSIWLKGDKVKFYIEDHGEHGLYAHITGYVGNEMLDVLTQRIKKEEARILVGKLKVEDHRLRFVERETRITFNVSNFAPRDIRFEENQLFEAYYDPTVSIKSVQLVEPEYAVGLLRTRKRMRRPIMVVVMEATPTLLLVSIPNSSLVAKVTQFDPNRAYQAGDVLYAYYVTQDGSTVMMTEKKTYENSDEGKKKLEEDNFEINK